MSDQQNTSRTALIILIKAKKPKRKKAAKWLYPWATEHHYTQLYRTWLKPVKEFVSEFMAKHQESILNGDSANSVIRSDAVAGESFHLMVQSLNNWVGAYISDDEQKKLRSPIFLGLGDVAQSAFNFNGNQYDKSVHSALGIDFPSDEAWWTSARKMWQDTNYDIIKSDIKKYIADINSATEQAVTNGWSVKALQEQIKALDDKITKSRAAFIARDQIGKLNGTITQKRMEDIGLTMYEWSGSVDERERDSHRVMEGKLCRWDDATVYSDDGGKTWKNRADIGGVLKHPGMDYQCRCCALAYFNELIDEAEGVTGGGVQSNTEKAKQTENEADFIKETSFFKDDIHDNDKKAFLAEYQKASSDWKAFSCKYGKDMRMDCYQNTNGYYSPSDNKIHFNINNIKKESSYFGYKQNMITFFHEYGHWFDYNVLQNGKTISQELTNLRDLLTQDALNYVNNFLTEKNLLKEAEYIKTFKRNSSKEKVLFLEISRDIFKNKYENSNISDIFEGVTGGKVVDGFGHGVEYWKRPLVLEKEAIAEMFETMATGGARKEAMMKYFPNAYKYFKDYVRGLL